MLWVRAVAVWLVLMVVESAHGTARMLLLVPAVGEARARRVSFFTGALLILGVACAMARWLDGRTRGRLLAVGGLWAAVTLAFELVLGRAVLDYDWDRILSDYDVSRGGLMGLGLVLLVLAPLIGARVRRVGPFGGAGAEARGDGVS